MANINFKDIVVIDFDYTFRNDSSSYHITEAEICGEEATDEQLDEINIDKDLVWSLLYKYWYC